MTADLIDRPDPIHYREASTEDVPVLVEIAGLCSEAHRRFSAPLLEYMATQPSCGLFVADARPILGFIVVHKLRGRTGEVVAIDVAPEARDLDIGSSLLAHGESWLVRNGAQSIFLEADAANLPALGLYAKLGYVACQEFEEDGTIRYLMQKLVAGGPEARLRIRR